MKWDRTTLFVQLTVCLSYQTPLVLTFIDYGKAFGPADRRAFAKVLSSYGIQHKYVKGISDIYNNDIAVVKVGNEVSSGFCIKSGVEKACFISKFILIILIVLIYFGHFEFNEN